MTVFLTEDDNSLPADLGKLAEVEVELAPIFMTPEEEREQEQAILRLYERGFGIKAIAREVGCSASTAKRKLAAQGEYKGAGRPRLAPKPKAKVLEPKRDPLDVRTWKVNEYTEVLSGQSGGIQLASGYQGDGMITCLLSQRYVGKRVRWACRVGYMHGSGPYVSVHLGVQGNGKVQQNSFFLQPNINTGFNVETNEILQEGDELFLAFSAGASIRVGEVRLDNLEPLAPAPEIDLCTWQCSDGTTVVATAHGWQVTFESAKSELAVTFPWDGRPITFKGLAHLLTPISADLTCSIVAETDSQSEPTPLRWSESGIDVGCRSRNPTGTCRIILSTTVPFFYSGPAIVLLRSLRLTAGEQTFELRQPTLGVE